MTAPGLTPLMAAARENDVQRIAALVQQKKADMAAKDAAGRTALLHALEAGHEEAALMLIFHGSDTSASRAPRHETPLILACRKGMQQVVERLVVVGAPLDAQDALSGETGLMKAILNADGWAACRLAGAGADADSLKNAEGETAWSLAPRHLEAEDFKAFSRVVEKMRAARQAARARELAENVESATVLQHDMAPLKRLTLRPRQAGPGTGAAGPHLA